jgi:hypothetical protein
MSDGERTVWTHGCDACDADEPVEYVGPIGYLCEGCREPEKLQELARKLGLLEQSP